MTLSWEAALERSPLIINVGGKRDHGGSRRGRWPDTIAVDLKGTDPIWNIRHRLPGRFDWPDGVVDRALSEHFLEHLRIAEVLEVCREVCRVLKPGGLFRLAVPDVFHPRKRPSFAAGYDLDDRHHQSIWTFQSMTQVLVAAGFPVVQLQHYWDESGHFHMHPIDFLQGHVKRSPQFDRRNREGREYGELWSTSLIIDAYKASHERVAISHTEVRGGAAKIRWTVDRVSESGLVRLSSRETGEPSGRAVARGST